MATPALKEAIETSAVIKNEVDKIPMGRFAEPEEIAESISFLASYMSSYMSGASLVVDGYVKLPLQICYNGLCEFTGGS